jgi:hypothetical protein
LNCSVVSADSASWRASGSVGWSMGIPFPGVSGRRDGRDRASRARHRAAQHPCQAPQPALGHGPTPDGS